jgi:hypothetical protein
VDAPAIDVDLGHAQRAHVVEVQSGAWLRSFAPPGRVEDWRAGLGRSSYSLLSRPFEPAPNLTQRHGVAWRQRPPESSIPSLTVHIGTALDRPTQFVDDINDEHREWRIARVRLATCTDDEGIVNCFDWRSYANGLSEFRKIILPDNFENWFSNYWISQNIEGIGVSIFQ